MRILFYILFFSLTSITYGQFFTKLSVKIGPTFSDQIKTPELIGDASSGIKYGLSGTIEPTILTFGSKKQFDFNTDFSFIQKGGNNYSPIITYSPSQVGPPTVNVGSEAYPVTINYFSFSPTIKANFWKIFFVKIGPRLDVFSNFYIRQEKVPIDNRTNKDFNSTTYGTTYGAGICIGKNKVKFISEFIGQNDFSNSSYYKLTGQTFKNYCYILNFGVIIILKNYK